MKLGTMRLSQRSLRQLEKAVEAAGEGEAGPRKAHGQARHRACAVKSLEPTTPGSATPTKGARTT